MCCWRRTYWLRFGAMYVKPIQYSIWPSSFFLVCMNVSSMICNIAWHRPSRWIISARPSLRNLIFSPEAAAHMSPSSVLFQAKPPYLITIWLIPTSRSLSIRVPVQLYPLLSQWPLPIPKQCRLHPIQDNWLPMATTYLPNPTWNGAKALEVVETEAMIHLLSVTLSTSFHFYPIQVNKTNPCRSWKSVAALESPGRQWHPKY